MTTRSNLFQFVPLTYSQRENVRGLISSMERGTAGSTAVRTNGYDFYGMVADAYQTLVDKRRVLTRQQLGAWVDQQFNTLVEVSVKPSPISPVEMLVSVNLTPTQQTHLGWQIDCLKQDSTGTTEMAKNGDLWYGLVPGAIAKMRSMRLAAPFTTRKQLGYLLEAQLAQVIADRAKVASGTAKENGDKGKRPSSFVFRTLTPDRLKAARSLVKDMLAERIGSHAILSNGRLTYGLTQLAQERIVKMRHQGKTRRDVGQWLDLQLTKALREQEAAAQLPGKGKRRVQFN